MGVISFVLVHLSMPFGWFGGGGGLRDVFGCSFSYFYGIFTTRFSNEEGGERE